jgi:hypothetical protein
MISHKHKCIFIHIPKCAGSTIDHLLIHNKKKWRRHDRSNFKNIHGSPFCYPHRRFIKNNPDFFIFTSVRNPWDRAVSSFFYSSSMSKTKHKKEYRIKASKYEMNNEKPFQNFIKDSRKLISKAANRSSEWVKQSAYLRRNFDYNKVIRFENFEVEAKEVLNKLSIEVESLPRIRKSHQRQGEHYSLFYDDDSMNIIGEIYKEDINSLSYSFENL